MNFRFAIGNWAAVFAALFSCDGVELADVTHDEAVSQPLPHLRLVYVDPLTESFSVRSYQDEPVDIGDYRICSGFSYQYISNLTVTNGSSLLLPGRQVTFSGQAVGWLLSDTAADLAFYRSSTFTDPEEMVDFVQWGLPGLGRESVAALKGIWSSGDYINGSGPYQYHGDGIQSGVTFWGTLDD